jgi:hypothetical protein
MTDISPLGKQKFNKHFFTSPGNSSLAFFLTVTDKISQQPENCENRNDPDLVQAFLRKRWVESDFKTPNLPLSLRFKGCGYINI